MTMELVRPDGAPVTQDTAEATTVVIDHTDPIAAAEALPGEQPKIHEPRWYRRRAEMCDKEFARIVKCYVEDMNAVKSPGIVPDKEAIRKCYGHEWAVFASKQLTDREPVPCRKTAMYEEIDRMVAYAAQQERSNTPLHQLESLDEFEFRLVGTSAMRGKVWLCSHLVVCVTASGQVAVFTRSEHFEVGLMIGNCLESVDFSMATLVALDLTIRDIHMLLGALKVKKIAAPTEGELELARGNAPGRTI